MIQNKLYYEMFLSQRLTNSPCKKVFLIYDTWRKTLVKKMTLASFSETIFDDIEIKEHEK